MQDPQERARADRHTRFTREASSAFVTRLQSKRGQQLSRAVGAAGVACQCTIEAFGEDPRELVELAATAASESSPTDGNASRNAHVGARRR